MHARRLIVRFCCAALLALPLPGQGSAASPGSPSKEGAGISQARSDYLQAIIMAEEGNRPEALLLLAQSLRLQPEKNPAAGLVFQFLAESRSPGGLVLRGHTGPVFDAVYSPDGTKILTASDDHTARVWDARTGHQRLPPLVHKDDILVAIFSPDGKWIATGSEDTTARVWDAQTGLPVGDPLTSTDTFESLAFSPDGKLLVTGGDNGFVRVWNAQTGKLVSNLIRYHDDVYAVGFSPDGNRVLSTGSDGRTDIFDVHSGKLLVTAKRTENNVYTASFSPDGKRFLTASGDQTAQVWDAATGKPIGAAMVHGFWIFWAAFNANATRVVTASWDHTARVWDAATGLPGTPPLRQSAAVTKAAFSPDGTIVVTGAHDHMVRFWDATTGDPLSMPLDAQGDVSALAFSPSGKTVMVASKDKYVRFWDVPPMKTPPSWLADLAEFASTQVSYDSTRTARLNEMAPEITALRQKLQASTSDDPWEKFGHWYFMDDNLRPLSPWSTESIETYVDDLIAQGDKDSLDYAMSLSTNHPVWILKLVKLRAKFNQPTPAPGQDDNTASPGKEAEGGKTLVPAPVSPTGNDGN